MKNKYYYEDIPVATYCREKGYNVGTIQNRIRDDQKRYPKKDLQEIIDHVIETYKKTTPKVIYTIDEKSISVYCKENEIDPMEIYDRIKYIKKEHPEIKDPKDIAKYAATLYEKYVNGRYNYGGMPLKEYCKLHPEYNYNTITTWCKRQKAKGTEKTNSELVEEWMQKEHKIYEKLFHEGIPLPEYCRQNNIVVDAIYSALYERKKQIGGGIQSQDILDSVIENYHPAEIIYIYKGQSLMSYCKENDCPSYSRVYSLVREKLEKDPTLDMEITIEETLKEINKDSIAYFYKNEPLIEYCARKELNIVQIRKSYRRKTIKAGLEKPTQEIIDKTVQKYENKKYLQQVNENFKKLETIKENSVEEIKEICEFLKIDFNEVQSILRKIEKYNIKQIIKCIWFFGDEDTDKNKSITIDKIKQIEQTSNILKELSNEDVLLFEIYDLIAIYKCGFFDTRNLILAHQENYIYNKIITLFNTYNLSLTEELKEDLYSESTVLLLEKLESSYTNQKKQFVKYLNTSIEGNLKQELKKRGYITNVVSLDETVKFNKSNNKSTKQRMEYIIGKSDISYNHDFLESTLNALSNLEEEQLKFIVLRFQECYSDEELAEVYQIPIEEIKERESKILETLRENTYFKEKIGKIKQKEKD